MRNIIIALQVTEEDDLCFIITPGNDLIFGQLGAALAGIADTQELTFRALRTLAEVMETKGATSADIEKTVAMLLEPNRVSVEQIGYIRTLLGKSVFGHWPAPETERAAAMIQVKTVTNLWSNGPDDPPAFQAADVFFGMDDAEARRLQKVTNDLPYLLNDAANIFGLLETIGFNGTDMRANHLDALGRVCGHAFRSWMNVEGEELLKFSTLIRERIEECGFAPVK